MTNDEILNKLEDMGAETDDVIERIGGSKEQYVDYLQQFLKDDNIVKLRQAVEAGDAKTAEHAIHTLKGMTLNLGLLPFTDVCVDMLQEFRDGNPQEAMAQLEDVEEAYKEWTDVIKE